MMKAGYTDPTRQFAAMNRELFGDLRLLAEFNGIGVGGLRDLDKPWEQSPCLSVVENGQPFSRIIDKMFYIPK